MTKNLQTGISTTGITRRSMLKTTAAAALIGAVKTAFPSGAFAAGAGPEVKGVKLGFIALTDSAPLIIAKEKGFFDKHGLPETDVAKQASWGATRDNLVLGGAANGIDGAHILSPLPYLMHTGKVTQNNKPVPMAILARLNLDSQGISVAKEYADTGVQLDSSKLKAAFEKKKAEGKEIKAAMTFPGGTHDLWIRYWLAAGGIDPNKDVSTIVVPPPQMVANMKVGNMDVFCVGEPWNEQLVNQGIGFTAATTGELWKGHPEKALGLRAEWIEKNPNAAKALLMAVMEAQQWCESMDNKAEMADILGKRQWFNVPTEGRARPPQGRHQLWQRPRGQGHRPLYEVLERRRLLSVQEPRHMVHDGKHPLGKSAGEHRHQGAGQPGEPRRHLARGRQGSRRRGGRYPRIVFSRQGDFLRRQGLRP